jgi:hypothetical protein
MQEDYHLTDDGDISTFLGIQIKRKRTATGGQEFHLTQPVLIKKICETVPLTDQRVHGTSADKILYKGGQSRKRDFHYRSAIGQLNTELPNGLDKT